MNIQNNLLIHKWGESFTLHTFTVHCARTRLDNYADMDVFKYMKDNSIINCPIELQRRNSTILVFGNFTLHFINPDDSILFYEMYKNK